MCRWHGRRRAHGEVPPVDAHVRKVIRKAIELVKSDPDAQVGLARIVASRHRASTLYQAHEEIRSLCF